MSDFSEMGLVVSKDEESRAVEPSLNIISEVADTLVTDSIHSESKTCINKSSNVIAINDVIGVESAPLSESTFENEIDALSRVITDYKGEISRNIKFCNPIENSGSSENIIKKYMQDENRGDESFDVNVKKVHENIQPIVSTVDKEIFGKSQDDVSTAREKNVHTSFLDIHEEYQKKKSHGISTAEIESHNTPPVTQLSSSTSTDNFSNTMRKLECGENADNTSNVTNLSKSLQMIGEAYISEDSQESDERSGSKNIEQNLRLDDCEKSNRCESIEEEFNSSHENQQFTDRTGNDGGANVKCKELEVKRSISSEKEIRSDEHGCQEINVNIESSIRSIASNIAGANELTQCLINTQNFTEIKIIGDEHSTDKNFSTWENQLGTQKLMDFEVTTDESDLKSETEEATLKPCEEDIVNSKITQCVKLNFAEDVESGKITETLINSEDDLSLCNKPNDLNVSPSVISNEKIVSKEKMFIEESIFPAFSKRGTRLFTTNVDNMTEFTKFIPTLLSQDPIKEVLVIDTSAVNNSEKLSDSVNETNISISTKELINVAIKNVADQELIKEKCEESIEVRVNVTNKVEGKYQLGILEEGEGESSITTTSMTRLDNIQEASADMLETMQYPEDVIGSKFEGNQDFITMDESNRIESKESTVEKKLVKPNLYSDEEESKISEALPQKSEELLYIESEPGQNMDSFKELSFDLIPGNNEPAIKTVQFLEVEAAECKRQPTQKIAVIPSVIESSDKTIDISINLEDGSKLSKDLSLQSNIESVCVDDLFNSAVPNSNSDISELESAVKFLQESQVQVESYLEVSPKIVESVADNESEQVDEQIIQNPIAISEAEIISEAAKLESERKAILMEKVSLTERKSFELSILPSKNVTSLLTIAKHTESEKDSGNFFVSERIDVLPKFTDNVLTSSESVPNVSVLEERLKEPPTIVIPNIETVKACELSTDKTSLLIQKDAKVKMESPKGSEKIETPRKDSDISDSENVGSPRIILKIAKSVITDCVEPKSPKSPKIRSPASSPNPDDSLGQKLGKIKLKLSKSGHPSIISNESFDESSQWHTESTSSLSPIGMKIKLSKSGEASVIQSEKYEDLDVKEVQQKFDDLKKTETSFGMKIKLSKTGDASIIQDSKEILPKSKEKMEVTQDVLKKSESSIGMKIKLSKTGDPSIIHPEKQYVMDENCIKRTESPLGMKIKLSKTGDASIVSEYSEEPKDAFNMNGSPNAMKIKFPKTKGSTSVLSADTKEDLDRQNISNIPKRTESPLGMKIKLSKTGDASIIHQDSDELTESTRHKDKLELTSENTKQDPAIGMKIKVSKTGEAMILHCKSIDVSNIHSEQSAYSDQHNVKEHQLGSSKQAESIGMKIKLSKSGDASIVQTEISADTEGTSKGFSKSEKEESNLKSSELSKNKHLRVNDLLTADTDRKEKQKNKEATKKIDEPALEMKIKLSKTGHPTIVVCESYADSSNKNKEVDIHRVLSHKYNKEGTSSSSSSLNCPSLVPQHNHSELAIEPEKQIQKTESKELSAKRKDVTISSIESKKLKIESKISQILPEVTIQPVATREKKQALFDAKSSNISREQIHVIAQEISITQVKFKENLESRSKNTLSDEKPHILLNKVIYSSPASSDCEIIEHRPELVIVNENSNSSQDVVIIEEVPPARLPELKVPKKRGRPRRNDSSMRFIEPVQIILPRDPLALDEGSLQHETRENERPRRTCRSQKSYAPPKRGRGGRGRGKRKIDVIEMSPPKKSRIDQDLTAIEKLTTTVISIDESPKKIVEKKETTDANHSLKQSLTHRKICKAEKQLLTEVKTCSFEVCKDIFVAPKIEENQDEEITGICEISIPTSLACIENVSVNLPDTGEINEQDSEKKETVTIIGNEKSNVEESKDLVLITEHQNWLTPSSRKVTDSSTRGESISAVQVIDEETRMSAESGSRSQTPARNISAPASEAVLNEESQGSVQSTATTESEKVKVKNRRMEINFDPDEGPFTVDKIAEYEWPLDRKGETFMVQEQISQYLGVKSFKRKYPDLKRRIVDMEERNYLRENGLVSESMCDMGLTSVCSSEVLDVMCSDFPDQYEEYRKHLREKQVKEHSKKQKELTAAANAEKNRIDLAEMAVQSALSWNINLNKSRMDTRKSSLDLQTFTIHMPKKEQTIEVERNISNYPVALIPGQYTDYYREYTPSELRYYPLNTVLYGPMKPNERKFDSQSECSQSDSDSDSSSDDSSSASSDGTQGTEESQSTMDDIDMEFVLQKTDVKPVKCKMCLKVINKSGRSEVLIQCDSCSGNSML
ncbi:uncharacterized protein LOC117174965 isoform X2 [Belonocnema kinseyi]|uniref:uncharacterized protein LOC117174965 isoform X2 n=1 Tax=Belonocnema kinseyi TaxID=2817044 RepID=UPI00143DAE83|nr:uncharacterized protein LOC117174965 isoform X2 [Belonocnema kinseyi]